MKHARYLIPALLLVLTTGCTTTFYAKSENASSQIDSWIDEQKYDKALETIRMMTSEHADYEVLTDSIPLIEAERQKYIQQVIKEASGYEPTKDWVSAEKVIDAALKNLPEAPELISKKAFYEQQREDRIYKDKAVILLSQAEYLITSRPYQESALYNSKGKYFAEQAFNRYLQEAKQVSRELYAVGYNYWQEEKYTQAKQALTLSIETSPNELSSELLDQILAAEQSARTNARRVQTKQAQEQLPDLEQSFYDRLNSNDLTGAQKVLNEISAMDVTDIEPFETQLAEHRNLRIERLIKSGDTLYNSGYIGEAIIRWQQAQSLAPENQIIQQRIERAETFISNLERWKAQ